MADLVHLGHAAGDIEHIDDVNRASAATAARQLAKHAAATWPARASTFSSASVWVSVQNAGHISKGYATDFPRNSACPVADAYSAATPYANTTSTPVSKASASGSG